MTSLTLEIYWQDNCYKYISEISKHLKNMFPMLIIKLVGQKEPSLNSFDSFRKQYDIQYLIQELTPKNKALWIVSIDISDFLYLYLYGAASKKVAVVSKRRTGCKDNLFKEACHEVGHLFGLNHCSSDKCVMKPSKNYSQLVQKHLSLCYFCRSKLELYSE